MDTNSTAVLMPGGSFRADGPSGRHDLLYDAVGGSWMLTEPARARRPGAVLLAQAEGLDQGLGALMASCGVIGPFRVVLPCGRSFARPGKVPADEVLAAFGYRSVRSVTAYTVLERPSELDAEAVRRELVMGLPGGVGLGEVEATDTEAGLTYWCCDLSVPFEGVLLLSRADAIVSEALAGCPFEPAGRAEVEADVSATPNTASVLSFPSCKAA